MQKLSIKKLSVLGMVLMAASAVTAAILPSKSDAKFADNGTLRTNATNNGKSCVTDNNGGTPVCSKSVTSLGETNTTAGAADSRIGGKQTDGNTSQTGVAGGTSVVA